MRRLKAQLMGMVSGKSQTPHDSTFLSDSATYACIFIARDLHEREKKQDKGYNLCAVAV